MLSLFVLLLLGAWASAEVPADLFILSTQWPQSVCEAHDHSGCNISSTVNTFTVRGLWPDNFDGEYPTYCDGDEFDLTQLEALQATMLQLWPNVLDDSTAEELWQSEWDKHGKCAVASGVFADQESYFSEALTKVIRYNAFQILANAGIGPNPDPQSLAAILKVLDDTFYYRFNVNCQFLSDPDRYVLSELQVCFDRSLNPVDCYIDSDQTAYHVHGCDVDGDVLYLPIQH